MAVPRPCAGAVALDSEDGAVAVVLDFMEPAVAGRRLG